MTKSYAFFGASTGCGLAAITLALKAGASCTALARVPSKLSGLAEQYPDGLHVRPGNAHDVEDVMACLVRRDDPARLVDAVCFSVGGRFKSAGWGKGWEFEDAEVCGRGVQRLLEGMEELRVRRGVVGRPVIVAVSSTGVVEGRRDYSLVLWPLYRFVLGVPHADKVVMERRLREAWCGKGLDKEGEDRDRVVVVRPSLLVEGDGDTKVVRVGVEDLASGEVESEAIGMRIGRAAVGRWMYEMVLSCEGGGYEGKAVTLTW